MRRSSPSGAKVIPPRKSVQTTIWIAIAISTVLLLSVLGLGQAGRRTEGASGQGGVMLNIMVRRDDGSTAPITSKQISVFDNGVQQDIRNLSRDPSPSKIAVLVDNSLTIRADVEKLEGATREF